MQAISESEELSIFTTDLIKDLVDYKWDNYARFQHFIGASIHLCYVYVLSAYIRLVFLERQAYDLIDPRFQDLIPEIRVGMTEKELKKAMEDDVWYREHNDFRIYPQVAKIYLILQGLTLIYPLVYDGT